MLHPTALIHPDARLGAGVRVGPFAVIEGAAEIGAGCSIAAHAIIGASVVMGEDNHIGYGAIIGGEPQDLGFPAGAPCAVRLGRGNRIREYVTIHGGSASGRTTVVGSECFLMAGAHLAHDCQLGDRVIIANSALLGGHVAVGSGVFIGGGCVFHQYLRVGRLAICQGASAFSKDIPPFTTAAGRNGVASLNVVGLRRAGLDTGARAEIKAAFALLYRSGLNTAQALAAAREREWGPDAREFWEFIGSAKKRGLCDLLGTRPVAERETDE
ncbi:MAG: acyl-ACP--UDP-N-acetylglucosamine O-acyltransferase [Chthoniobacter sp.]|nr:acyl-ACP--UDP-N-acetylglucosamine O-acyltransferase [Chthoniobacter sp.]